MRPELADREMTKEESQSFERFLRKRDHLRKFYNTVDGAIVLTDLLNDLGFFRMDLEEPQDIAKQNSAKELLYKLGIWQEHNIYRIVEALLKMPYTSEEEYK